jgi:hypothetical protein
MLNTNRSWWSRSFDCGPRIKPPFDWRIARQPKAARAMRVRIDQPGLSTNPLSPILVEPTGIEGS